jgi:hypothetical protein
MPNKVIVYCMKPWKHFIFFILSVSHDVVHSYMKMALNLPSRNLESDCGSLLVAALHNFHL